MKSAARVSIQDGSRRALTPRPCSQQHDADGSRAAPGRRATAATRSKRLHRRSRLGQRAAAVRTCRPPPSAGFGPRKHHFAVGDGGARIAAGAVAGDAGDRDRRRRVVRRSRLESARARGTCAPSDRANSIQVASAAPSGSSSTSTRPSDPPSSTRIGAPKVAARVLREREIGLALIVLHGEPRHRHARPRALSAGPLTGHAAIFQLSLNTGCGAVHLPFTNRAT